VVEPRRLCALVDHETVEEFDQMFGSSCDNALAETINGLYKAEVIHRRGP
jgi:hypothetical protein